MVASGDKDSLDLHNAVEKGDMDSVRRLCEAGTFVRPDTYKLACGNCKVQPTSDSNGSSTMPASASWLEITRLLRVRRHHQNMYKQQLKGSLPKRAKVYSNADINSILMCTERMAFIAEVKSKKTLLLRDTGDVKGSRRQLKELVPQLRMELLEERQRRLQSEMDVVALKKELVDLRKSNNTVASSREGAGHCEVCFGHFKKLAMHQVLAKHGKAWDVRRNETGSEKKRRLATERRGRAKKKRQLQPRDSNVSMPT